MIVGASFELPIGYKGNKMTDFDGHLTEQPFIVLRKATYEEYVAQNKPEALEGFDFSRDYFYEVSTD